ncbi:MAG: metallophosphoesterase family protein [Chitinophagales bacterium]
MKVLLLSDTHGYIDDAILKHCVWSDEVWHAGDFGNRTVADKITEIKPLRGVWGNIDGGEIRNEFPLDNRFTVEKLDVLMTHIGGYPGKYDARVKKIFSTQPPKLFICGHSHILRVMPDKMYNFLFMNPGAAGISGIHKIRTMLRFEINNGIILRPEVIEVGLRATIR